MSLEEIIKSKLMDAVEPEHLEVINESHLHAGHMGDDGSGESHWRIVIESEQLNVLSRVDAHRAINAILESELRNKIHALAIKLVK